MMSLSDLSPMQRSLLTLGGVLAGILLGIVLMASDFDLSTLKTIRSQSVSGGAVLDTQYNPLGLLGLTVLLLAAIAGLVMLLAWAAPIVMRASTGQSQGGVTSNAVAKTTQKLDRELAGVLAMIRGHIASNDGYARSLANAQTRLAGLQEGEQVRVIVSLLVAENERMRRDTDELKGKLENSKSQIEELRQSLTQAEETVQKDPLTGTGNRRRFDNAIDRAILDCKNTRKPLSLVMCDIDHFKRVNDAFGHQVGDEIIKMFARVIEANVREGDTVIRYGGEEFAIILPSADQVAARAIAERIRHQFESKKLTIRETGKKIGQLTASFGVAQLRPEDDVEALLKRADAKLYDAKSAGRNRVAALGPND